MRNSAFTMCALALLLACGGGSGAAITEGPEDPADAVEALMAAMVAADVEGMMPYLPRERREEFTESDRENVERNSGFLSQIEYEVISSELNEQGDSARVTVQLTVMGQTAPKEMTAVTENGRWVVVDGGTL
ncbi:MAG: hypothetical protein ACQETZ_03125 [Candidatus Fermentibacterota bacterium]